MKALKYGFGLALIGGLALNVSCGGSSSDSDDSSAGTSSTAGDSSTAGSSSSFAGSDNSIAGGTSFGGDNSSSGGDTTDQGGGPASGGGSAGRGGGRAGAGNNGGAPASGGAAATNPADCPMANLAENAMCTPLATTMERCMYGDESCRCRAQVAVNPGRGGAGGAAAAADGRWTCAAVCPAAKPTVGDACTPGLACPYTGGGCVCGQSQKWQCQGGGNMGGGGASGTAGASGRAGAGGMSAAGGTGGNGGTMCPMQKPTAGRACTGSGVCTYANKTGCACVNDKWLCD